VGISIQDEPEGLPKQGIGQQIRPSGQVLGHTLHIEMGPDPSAVKGIGGHLTSNSEMQRIQNEILFIRFYAVLAVKIPYE